MGYHMEAEMTDVLIRDVPEEVIAALDAHAARLALRSAWRIWRGSPAPSLTWPIRT
jgi:hypothetical protein